MLIAYVLHQQSAYIDNEAEKCSYFFRVVGSFGLAGTRLAFGESPCGEVDSAAPEVCLLIA